MRKQLILRLISAILIMLYFYTAVSKMLDYDQFRRQMLNQTFPHWLAHLTIWLLPPVEILTALLLLEPTFRLKGFYLSTVLMFVFTTYTGLVIVNFFDRHPCSCGGVISSMSFEHHLIFNLFFLALSVTGTYCCRKVASAT